MANRKLTELPSISFIPFDSTDLLYLVDINANGGKGVSKSIPYNLLVGGNLVTLSAYNTQNTLNVNFLSAAIQNNTGNSGELRGDVVFLSGAIDIATTEIIEVSALALAGDNTGQLNLLTTDVLVISTVQLGLSAELDELSDDISTLLDPLTGFSADEVLADIAYLSGEIDANDNFLSAAIDANNNFLSAAIDINTTYVSQVSVVPTAETPAQTHTVPINIGGTVYKILLAT
tara:strand:- start:2105 stop:2800 length:696 start_codon:yes stop_codon:yes gene_type:complete